MKLKPRQKHSTDIITQVAIPHRKEPVGAMSCLANYLGLMV
jgi:hypothetical protein